ncbi:DUF4123 domain-containing protein [Aestuariibius sp. 2305UL40-4]|uniref:DUF4123 domain-containing protein n=1 Tax=Aestuariibius violaceus TaxID=3234132 RepID=UPI00345E7752
MSNEVWLGTGVVASRRVRAAIICDNATEFERYLSQYLDQAVFCEDVTPASLLLQQDLLTERDDALAIRVLRQPPVAVDGPEIGGTSVWMTQTSIDVEPLDAQFGIFEPKTVPDSLHPWIFGPQGGVGAAYALLDGSRMDGLPEYLDGVGADALCLWQGTAFDESAAAAPWLVRLEEGASLARAMFTAASYGAGWTSWDQTACLVLRTEASLPELRAHLRRFGQLRESDGRVRMFRFADPAVMTPYLTRIADWPERLRTWFYPNEGHAIELILALRARTQAHAFTPTQALAYHESARISAALTERDRRVLKDAMVEITTRRMAEDLKRLFPAQLGERDLSTIEGSVARTFRRMERVGFRHAGNLFHLAAWDLLLVRGIADLYNDPQVEAALTSPVSEHEKMALLKSALARQP